MSNLNSPFKVRTVCPWCNLVSYVDIDEDAYRRWKSGALLQRVAPELSIDDREKLISGTCSDCWERLNKSDKDED